MAVGKTLQLRDRGSRIEFKEGSLMKRIGFVSTLSRREVKGGIPQIRGQYFKNGWIKPVYNLDNRVELKHFCVGREPLVLWRVTYQFGKYSPFQDKLEDIWIPKIFQELRDKMWSFNKLMTWLFYGHQRQYMKKKKSYGRNVSILKTHCWVNPMSINS